MDTEDIKNKAAIKAAQRLADLQAVEGVPEIQALQAKEANRRALTSRNASHGAAMHDFGSGQALKRAVAAYGVKRSVADLAKSEGRTVAGATIVVPEPKPEVESETASA